MKTGKAKASRTSVTVAGASRVCRKPTRGRYHRRGRLHREDGEGPRATDEKKAHAAKFKKYAVAKSWTLTIVRRITLSRYRR